MLNKIIAIVLLLTPASIFFAKGTMGFLIILTSLLILDIVKEKKIVGKLIGILLISIVVFNFNKIKPYFIYNIKFIDINSTAEYGIRVISFMSIVYFFSNVDKVELVYKNFVKYSNILLIEVIISQINLIYLFISGKGYSETWGLNNFIGPYLTPHTYAYSLIIMLIIIEFLVLLKRSNKLLLLYVFPLFSSLFCGARTPIVMMWVVFIAIRKFKTSNIVIKKRFKIKNILIFIGVCIISLLLSNMIIDLVMNSNIITKFIETFNDQKFDNGRTDYWRICIDYYLKSDIIYKLLGNGIYCTVLAIKESLGYEIWAHSDWIDILNSYGIIVILAYLGLYVRYFLNLKKWTNVKCMMNLLGAVFIFLSTYNGIINYTHFLFVFCYISILVVKCKQCNHP